ncbi:NADP-dependent malic enzyme-like [Scaptodrosophila lebanonensis]|uniref:NADP-dependent malic enzyme-like n=1 Tax=Drosophila lebanonensis TaxID=7225 RepID=A0A6J2U4N6_DROLE|nr:NADP-dependent malic enzyme-like [Scaptodrosophila lebanonensis]
MAYRALLSIAQLRFSNKNSEMCTKHRRYSNVVPIGAQLALQKSYNKGLAFTIEERQRLGINGLFPCSIRTQSEQLFSVSSNFLSRPTAIAKYRYMLSLRQRHESLYYLFIGEHIEDVLPVIYTPTVGVACTVLGLIFRAPMGMFVTKYDRGHISDVLGNWPESDVRAVCITDGERILGLGDLGANGMAISLGKIDLYTALARIHPSYLIPISLDVGTDNEQLLADPLYIGARDKRLRGKEYDDLVDELMEAIVKRWGRNTLIHFEDFGTPNALKFIEKYQKSHCCFNDDIQGTAATALGGFLGVSRATQKPLNEHVFLFVGAGSASLGIANLLMKHLKEHADAPEAGHKIFMCDAEGLITKSRKDLSPTIKRFAQDVPETAQLEEVMKIVNPSILLGATGSSGIFNENILRFMAKNHERPAIFALSNPTDKAECTAEQAFNFTEGRAIFCSGSPFPPVVINGKRHIPGQANNCFAFPGVALGVLCASARYIPDEVFIVAAQVLSEFQSDENVAQGIIYPRIKEAPEVAFQIGVKVAEYIFNEDLANASPAPENICEFVLGQRYKTDYESALRPTWEYPKLPHIPLPKDPDVLLNS